MNAPLPAADAAADAAAPIVMEKQEDEPPPLGVVVGRRGRARDEADAAEGDATAGCDACASVIWCVYVIRGKEGRDVHACLRTDGPYWFDQPPHIICINPQTPTDRRSRSSAARHRRPAADTCGATRQ